MAHKSKLKSALEAYQGKDQRLEHQRRLQKKAAKEKRKKEREMGGVLLGDEGDDEEKGVQDAGAEKSVRDDRVEEGNGLDGVEEEEREEEGREEVDEDSDEGQDGDGDDDDEDEENRAVDGGDGGIDISHIDDSESESELEDLHDAQDDDGDEFEGLESEGDENGAEDDAQDEEEDIPLSELSSLSSTAKEDIIPHQRLQINNTSALLTSLKSISLPLSKLPFSEHQSITSTSPTNIPDINDDLSRELTFYKQSLEAVQAARKLLKAEGIPFSRPTDYFAEMVKSDEHMGRIKEKLIDEASRKKAAAEARKLRDLKKFGKQVQVAKLQERDKAKRETLSRIQSLKRKRQQGDLLTTTHEEENNDDPFSNITVENDDNRSRRPNKRSKPNPSSSSSSSKSKLKGREKRDAKFGFGGKKRHAKSGDAISSGDVSGLSKSRMKGRTVGTGSKGKGKSRGTGTGKGKRLGKSRRLAGKR